MCQTWSAEDSAEQFLASPACPPAVVPLVTSIAVHRLGPAAVSFSWIYTSKYFSAITIWLGQDFNSLPEWTGKNTL